MLIVVGRKFSRKGRPCIAMGSPEPLLSLMVRAYFDAVRYNFYHRFQNFISLGGKIAIGGLLEPEFDCGDSGNCGNLDVQLTL
jgi:hypothetical protein